MGWETGAPPEPGTVAAAACDPLQPLIEPLVADAEERWSRGLPAGLETYATAHPPLYEHAEACRALLMCEAARRQQEPEAQVRRSMLDRFPALADHIDEVMELMSLMRSASAIEAKAELAAGDRIGKYELLDLLGKGGFGEVWRAHDHDLHRYIALKLIPTPQTTGQKAGRLGRSRRAASELIAEARAAAAIDHENVVRVHDAGILEDLELVYIDCQLAGDPQPLENDPLHVAPARSLEEAQRPSAIEASRIMEAACRAIGAAHARGVLHRDIKPGNILLTPSGRAMVTDFGLALGTWAASARDEGGSGSGPSSGSRGGGRVAGTPAYMAPEQARGEAVTPLSDIYALGATLRFLLTGDPPYKPSAKFSASARDDVLAQARLGNLPKLAATRQVHPTLCAILDMAMAARPQDRYLTPTQMADDLRAFREQRPTLAAAPSAAGRGVLFLRRHLVVASIAAACLIAAGVTAGASVRRVLQERDRAVIAEAKAAEERDRALAAQAQVRQQRDDARAANQFVFSVFNSTAMGFGRSEATIQQAIEQIDRFATQRLIDRPLAEASVRSNLMGVLLNQARGEDNAQRALSIYADMLGHDAPETLAARRAVLLSNRLRETQKAKLPELRALRDRCVAALGSNDAETLRTELEVLTIESFEAPQASLPGFERLLAAFKSNSSIDDLDTTRLMDRLATIHAELGDFDAAIAVQTELIGRLEQRYGKAHVMPLSRYYTTGLFHQRAGRPNDAEAHYRIAAEGLGKVAPESSSTALIRWVFAKTLRERHGASAQSIALTQEAVDRTRRDGPPGLLIAYLVSLGDMQVEFGRVEAGLASLREAIAIAEERELTLRGDIKLARSLLEKFAPSKP